MLQYSAQREHCIKKRSHAILLSQSNALFTRGFILNEQYMVVARCDKLPGIVLGKGDVDAD